MPGILNTNGAVVSRTASQFESYDVIRHSAANPDDEVDLIVTTGGVLNLLSELQTVSATITARVGGLQLTTGGGHDVLIGSADRDVFDGSAGNDTLEGGGGNDSLFGGTGNDAFVVYGSGSGVDTFRGGSGIDLLSLRGNTQLSRLTLDAAASVEQIDNNYYALSGTTGSDVFDISGVTSYAHNTRIDLREGVDRFVGSQIADDVAGGEGNDTLSGGLGNDTIEGGVGNDTLNGDDGNDYFVIYGSQSGVDLFRGGTGTDTLYLDDDAQLSRLTLDADASVEVIDTNHNPLTGTAGADVFDISGVLAYANSTRIDLREGNDRFSGSQLADNVAGGDGNDTLNGGFGNDTLEGGIGNDTLNGQSGNDYFVVFGSQNGVDTFRGGSGTDVFYLTDDTELNILMLDGAASVEQIDTNFNAFTGTAAGDTFDLTGVLGYANSTRIDLREGDDTFTGSRAADNVFGGDGADYLRGWLGNDTVNGGLGNDRLTGNSGNDVFLFNTALNRTTNVDTITDFGVGTDIIGLESDIFSAIGSSLAATEFTTGSSATASTHRIIYNSNTGDVFYDADGAGGASQVLFARVGTGLSLTADSFDIY